jgi:hypothetical protein
MSNFDGKTKSEYCAIILKRLKQTGHNHRTLGSLKVQMYAIKAKFEKVIDMLKRIYSLSDAEIKTGEHTEHIKRKNFRVL